MFNNMHYNLPPWSISILPDCRNVVFNTAKVWNNFLAFWFSKCQDLRSIGFGSAWCFRLVFQVGVQTSQLEMVPTNSPMLVWESYNEDISAEDDSTATMTTSGLLEQINVTKDTSDYLWYITRWDHFFLDQWGTTGQALACLQLDNELLFVLFFLHPIMWMKIITSSTLRPSHHLIFQIPRSLEALSEQK